MQLDTLQMVRRSQYLVLWSRIGDYPPQMLDDIAYGDPNLPADKRERRLFEYWMKEACYIPLTEFRFRLPLMLSYRDKGLRWNRDWLAKPENRAVRQAVLDRITREGGLRSSDFEHQRDSRAGWWDWKPAKIALEQLYNEGTLLIDHRRNFQRVYDLAERVLPTWVDQTPPTPEAFYRHSLTRILRALGIAEAASMLWYMRIRVPEGRPYIKALIEDGLFVPIQVETAQGGTAEMLIHQEDLPTLNAAAEGDINATHTTFLSPFDNLFWAVGRDMVLWNFLMRMEMYTPEPKRRWGYFSLPILHGDQLVGRFDPKLERKAGLLRVKSLHAEPNITLDEKLMTVVAATFRQFAAWHQAKTLVIEKSDPPEFKRRLEAAL
ncbi:MAG: winged helix-turn-helix domain-containing protein [Anaerolineae bacterium]